MVQSALFKGLRRLTENCVCKKPHSTVSEGSCGGGSIQGFVAPFSALS